MSKLYRGGCLCGGVRYEYTGEFSQFLYCHCQDCRKASGSAFNANADIDISGFRLLQGADLLKTYEASPGKQRVFCATCGSPLYSRKDWQPTTLGLRMGTLETPVEVQPQAHQFVASKAAWDSIHDVLPQYPARISNGTAATDRKAETACS